MEHRWGGLSASGMLSGVRPEHSAWRALSRPPGPAEISESSCTRACRARPRRGLHLAFALVVNGGSERGSSALRHPQGQVSSSAHALLSRAWPLKSCAPVPACGTPRGGGGLAGAAAGLILPALADHQRGGLGGRHVPEAGEGPCVLSHRRGGGKALGARFPRRHGPQLVGACHCPGEGLPCSHSSL